MSSQLNEQHWEVGRPVDLCHSDTDILKDSQQHEQQQHCYLLSRQAEMTVARAGHLKDGCRYAFWTLQSLHRH